MVRDTQGLARRLVLGLVRLGRARAGRSTGRRAQSSPYPGDGLWAVLHQLPRLGEGQLDLLGAEEHQGRAGRAAGVPQPELLPRSVLAEPAGPHPERGREGRRRAPATIRTTTPPSRASSRSLGGPPRAATNDDRDAAGDLRQRLAEAGRADRRKPVRHLGSMPRLPQRGRHRPAIRHDAAGPGRKADQHLALWHLARLADGPCRARSDLLRAARERDRHLPSRETRR